MEVLAVLVWPGVVLLIVITGFIMFKKPFERLLDRATKIGKAGIEASTPQELEEPKPHVTAEQLLKPHFDNALLLSAEEWVREVVDKDFPSDMKEREKVFIRVLASTLVGNRFESTYKVIFGSQLNALEFINSLSQGAAAETLQIFYKQAAAQQPGFYATYSFDDWLGFIESQGLVVRKEQTISITLEGREFLKHVMQRGYTLYKAG